MEVLIHLTDINFTSRCTLQDCYIIPNITETATVDNTHNIQNTFPQATLISPYMLQTNNNNNKIQYSLLPLTLLWRCSACGKEKCVAKETLSSLSLSSSESNKSKSKSTSRTETSSSLLLLSQEKQKQENNPSICSDCYSCPRCNAFAIHISLTRKLKYIAKCSYCYWNYSVMCEELQDLLKSLASSTPNEFIGNYYQKVYDWRNKVEENNKIEEEKLLSISRLAIEEYKSKEEENNNNNNNNNSQQEQEKRHPALILEEIRDSIRKRQEKSLYNSSKLNYLKKEEETPITRNEESEIENIDNCTILKDNSEILIKKTQMEQHGFYLPSNHPFWKTQKKEVGEGEYNSKIIPYFLHNNMRLPLFAMILNSNYNLNSNSSSSSFIYVINGIEKDPSFYQIKKEIFLNSGNFRFKQKLIPLQLSAALYIPIIQHSSKVNHNSSHTLQQWFTIKNFSQNEIILRRFTIEKQVGGIFNSSLIIPINSNENDWLILPSQYSIEDSSDTIDNILITKENIQLKPSMHEFCITLTNNNNNNNNSEKAQVMVGFILEVVTVLPIFPQENNITIKEEDDEENEFKKKEKLKHQHVVTYGMAISW